MTPDTFLKNFKCVINAHSGLSRLREMIYALAIRGNLSQQLESDGTGHELLEDISAAKQDRIDAGTFKRSPKLESIDMIISDSVPRIPRTWAWTRLVDVGEINPRNEAEDDTLVAFAPMNVISEIHNRQVRCEEKPWASIKKGFTHFADGDVMVAKITPCFENGKGAVLRGLKNGIGAGTTELHVVRPLPGVLPEFIYIFLRSPYFKIVGESHMTGTAGQKRLPTEYFALRQLPLPPLEEQKRIVAKVDELMRLCDRLEAQQQEREKLLPLLSRANHTRFVAKPTENNLHPIFSQIGKVIPDDLRGTVFQLAVTGRLVPRIESESDTESLLDKMFQKRQKQADESGAEISSLLPDVERSPQFPPIPKHWRWVRLGNVTSKIGSGSTPRGGAKVYVSSGVPFLRSQNIWNDGIRLDDVAYIASETHHKMRNTYVLANDILLNITGASLGRCAKVSSDFTTANVSQHVTIIRPLLPETRDFLHICLLSPFGQGMIWDRQVGMAREGLSKKVLERFEIPLPPLEEQLRIVQRVEYLLELVDRLRETKTASANTSQLFAAAAVAAITSTEFTESEMMKPPKTELVTALKVGTNPKNAALAPLAALLAAETSLAPPKPHANSDGDLELTAKELWQISGLEIDDFYRQLKSEMANGWIEEDTSKRVVKEVEVG